MVDRSSEAKIDPLPSVSCDLACCSKSSASNNNNNDNNNNIPSHLLAHVHYQATYHKSFFEGSRRIVYTSRTYGYILSRSCCGVPLPKKNIVCVVLF